MRFAIVLVALICAPLCPVANSQETSSRSCSSTTIDQDPFIHKASYTIGVHATRGLDEAYDEVDEALGAYLTATAGKKFNPPIEFNVVPEYFEPLLTAIDEGEVDFIYANPAVYSCIGTEDGATALTTVVKHLSVRGQTFDLDVYGGVIAVRHDRNDINTIADLKDKIIGAGAIIDLMGGQMQIYEMERAGMSYVNDPKQMIFTKDQIDVVRGVLSGRFDVGFIRTDQIELTKDELGQPIDPDLFKILEPKIYVMDDGELFPFLHSTDIIPEWPFASLPSVPSDVSLAVQEALMEFGDHALIGQILDDCMGNNETDYCDSLSLKDLIPNPPCTTSRDLARLAYEASLESKISSHRTARSYFELSTIQQKAGFLEQDEKNNWYCLRPSNLYDGITCPEGHFKRHENEFLNGCAHVGLQCDDNPDYSCFCSPCVKSHEVDVYHLDVGQEDPHLEIFFGEALPGCDKMSICGTIQQGDTITLRIYDNLMREGADIKVVDHAGDVERDLKVTNIEGTFAYEFDLWDDTVQVHVIDIQVDGKAISQSPIRVVVQDKDCADVAGTGSHRVPDETGNCVCAGNTYEIGGTCLESAYFFLIIFAAVFLVVGVLVFLYLGYKKKQSDSVWHINVDELHFNEPPEIIGQGGFGVVILGQYRGTKVAVKRVLPPIKARRGQSGSLRSGRNAGGDSGEVMSVDSEQKSGEIETKPKEKNKTRSVQFGSDSGDVESQTISKSGSLQFRGSYSGSNKDWERLMMNNHSDNDVLRILESATASGHGSGQYAGSMASSMSMFSRVLPLWLRFDEHSKRVAEFTNEMRLLSRLRHPCITTVMGAVVSSAIDPMLVMEYMEYGSLYDLLHNETMTPGGEIILQVVRDIVQGMQFLHASKPPILHGDLKAKNILVDSRFRAKVADFGFSHIKSSKQGNILQGTPFYMAPEYLRRRTEYTTSCDIYSFAMIIYEIYARASPFEGEDPRKILPKVCHPRLNKRPQIPPACPPKMVDLMKKCWSANAFFRPSAKDIDYAMVEMSSQDTEPLETGAHRDIIKRKPTSLYDVFPKHIADALNAGKKVEAESHEIVTIVFSDIVGFTTISDQFSPMKVSTMLDRLYHAFDDLAGKHGIFKVETIGDAYMGVTNIDGSQFDTHVKQAAEYAQDAIRAANQILIDEENPSLGCVQIRIGIHSGPVVSNVIGSLNPRYGLFGDTVNTAARMESNSMPGKIHCSFASAELLKTQAPDIPVNLRGMIKVKGKGKMKTYWVGDEDLLKPLAPNPMLSGAAIHEPMEPLSEHEEDDSFPVNIEHHHEFLDHEGSDHSSSQGDSGKSDQHSSSSSNLGKPHHDELSESHRTQDTHIMSVSGDSLSGSERRDHFIKVHAASDKKSSKPHHKAQIQMDGTILTN